MGFLERDEERKAAEAEFRRVEAEKALALQQLACESRETKRIDYENNMALLRREINQIIDLADALPIEDLQEYLRVVEINSGGFQASTVIYSRLASLDSPSYRIRQEPDLVDALT